MTINEQMNRTACVTWKAKNGDYEVNLRASDAEEATLVLDDVDGMLISHPEAVKYARSAFDKLQDMPIDLVMDYIESL